MKFEWDEDKAEANLRKHEIWFQDAARAFDDESAVVLPDRFVDGEDRYQLIGWDGALLILLVVHTYRERLGEVVSNHLSPKGDTASASHLWSPTFLIRTIPSLPKNASGFRG